MSFVEQYLAEARQVIERLDSKMTVVNLLVDTRSRKGRLFVLGVGSSAANASQAVNDFRKIAGIEPICLDRQHLRADGSKSVGHRSEPPGPGASVLGTEDEIEISVYGPRASGAEDRGEFPVSARPKSPRGVSP